eukprot:4456019-Prorocentrum_lima.AAC.1
MAAAPEQVLTADHRGVDAAALRGSTSDTHACLPAQDDQVGKTQRPHCGGTGCARLNVLTYSS